MFRRLVGAGIRAPWGGGSGRPSPENSRGEESQPVDERGGAGRPPTNRLESPSPDSTLDDVAECRTLADAVDAAALGDWLPPAWHARTEVVKFGNDPVTEVLALEGRGHRLVVDPVHTTAPEGPATCYVRPAGTARRREVATTENLHEALAVALEHLAQIDEHVEPVLPVEGRVAAVSAELTPAENS